ncbi:hypothetical protein D3C86_2049670 [compost metagenome]
MGGDATAGFQDVAGDGEFVGRCADISKRIMQDEVLKMDEFAIDPERGMRFQEMGALEKALTDRRASNALIQARERDTVVESRPHQGSHADFREIVSP